MSDTAPAYEPLKRFLKQRLAERLDEGASGGGAAHLTRETVMTGLRVALSESTREFPKLSLSAKDQDHLLAELTDEIIGMGPLEVLLADPAVTEIMINGPRQVYVERRGRLERTPTTFRDSSHLLAVIERLLDSAGVSVTSAEPCVDASLPDGSRINVIVPPLVLNGPTVTIRKKMRHWTMPDFLSLESLSPQAAEFLEGCVKAKVNFVISGGSSTGKTTLVSILSSFILQEERIITIENVAELELPNHEHWIRLVARGANLEGRGEISLRMLVRNALRMRPDRIILGEARAGEALDVVQAMHTGHQGVMTVLHADSPQAALERLQVLMLMSGLELPSQACQMQIARAVDLVVHLARFADGSRRVTSIAQVTDQSSGGFHLEELFTFEVQAFRDDGTMKGSLRYTGVQPKFLHKFQLNNVSIPSWIARDPVGPAKG